MAAIKLALIGLDGLDPLLMKNWDLPNIEEIMKTGSHGTLMSTIPPVSAPAWATVITGKDPSWHGVTHFVDTDVFRGKERLINSKSIRGKKLWQRLNEMMFSTGMFTVPLTYPVERVNGFMVSGLMTPSRYAQIFPYLNMKIELLDWQKYKSSNEVQKFIKDIWKNTQEKWNTMACLTKTFDIDFLFMVEGNTDAFQHRVFYGGMTELNMDLAGKYFHYVDGLIGSFRDKMLGECPIIIMSDHGHGKIPTKKINVNPWLAENGFVRIVDKEIRGGMYFYNAWMNIGFIRMSNGMKHTIPEIKRLLANERWCTGIVDTEKYYTGPLRKHMPDIVFYFGDDYAGGNGIKEVVEDIPKDMRYVGHRMKGFWASTEKLKLNNLEEIYPTVVEMMKVSGKV